MNNPKEGGRSVRAQGLLGGRIIPAGRTPLFLAGQKSYSPEDLPPELFSAAPRGALTRGQSCLNRCCGCLARMPLPRILGCRRLDQGYVIRAENRGVGLEQHGPVHGRAGARSCGWRPRLRLGAGLRSGPGDGRRRAMATTKLAGLQQRP